MASPRAPAVLLLALAGCASVPAGPPPPPPERSFRDVRGVALLHRPDLRGFAPAPGDVRGRDPLDSLQRALDGRGLKTVSVELSDRPAPELAPVEEAARLAEWSGEAARGDLGGPGLGSIGEKAAAALDLLGADAFAVYSRATGWTGGMPPPPSLFGPSRSMPPPPAPVSALSVVARDGTVVTFSWGGDGPFSAGLANAAEAVDAVLTLLLPPPPE